MGYDYYNRALDKGRENTDVTHRYVSVVTYELPFGRGRRFFAAGGWRDRIAGGWDLTWTETLQSGPPMTVTMSGSPYRYHLSSNRPNMVLPNDQGVVDNWQIGENRFPFAAQNRYFNFDAFQYPAAFTLGTLGRNTFEAPGMRWAQLSMAKEFKVRERVTFTLRWDVNNVTKEPQFAAPNSTYNLEQHDQLRHVQRDPREFLGRGHRAPAPHHRRPLPVLSARMLRVCRGCGAG